MGQNGSNMVENGFKKTGNGRIEFEKKIIQQDINKVKIKELQSK